MSSKIMEQGGTLHSGVSSTSVSVAPAPSPGSGAGNGNDIQDKPVGSQPDQRESGALGLLHRVLRAGRVEETGIEPLPVEARTSTRFYNLFTVWCSMNCNILPVLFGMLGPTAYGLSLGNSTLVIVFFSLLSTTAPAYLSILGPKTGMRQMIQARFSFGRYLVTVPALLNLATLTGFVVIICVVGGQCLSAVSDGDLAPDAGIVIIALLALFISFCGFKVLHYYETYAFIPAAIALIVAAGCGGSDLKKQATPAASAAAPAVLSFGMIVASYMLPWAAIASDLSTYFDPKVPSWRVFSYTYLGLWIPSTLLMILGAAIGGALPNSPALAEGYDKTLVGGVLAAMLSSAGGFGKFLVVVLSLTLLGNCAGTIYAITLNFQNLAPGLVRVPRYVFAVVVTVIVIPIAIKAAQDFFYNLENFIGLIGYWSAVFFSIFTTEHLYFRKGNYDSYDHAAWERADLLPIGVAAIASGVLSFGLIIPCMAQVWWTGPIAEKTGDIGFEVALVLSALLYVPLRTLEKRLTGR